SKTPSTVLVFPTSIARSMGSALTEAGADLLHVAGQDALLALLGAENQRPIGIDVLRHTAQLAVLRLDQDLLSQRGGERPPPLANGGEALLGVPVEPPLQGAEEPGGEGRAIDRGAPEP